MIRQIALDLDGVCNRFPPYTLNFLGCPIDPFDDSKYPIEAGWDIVKAANILLGREEFSTSKFWKSIPRHIWAQCPVSEELSWLLGHCEALVGKENICLLTATTLDPECPAGKLEWIHKFMPKWMHRQYLLGPFKTFTASSDTLLIDDADKNIDAFRKAGGRTLIVPRPWNSFHATPTLQYLTERFAALFSENHHERELERVLSV
jgi:hypothetical protein